MIKTLLLVGLGGAAGSILRYLTGYAADKWIQAGFPVGTLIVNILGSFLIGLTISLLDRYTVTSPELKYLLVVGFLGGFTTFSAFTYENVNLLQTGNIGTALLYMVGSVVAGLAAVWVGFALTR
ncbi:MAG: CrcB protein [Bacteroidetes bacterium HLUCCA01]|nr:MAG: CrcB protein [Bacteroidetes bacterium HLUCCA01]